MALLAACQLRIKSKFLSMCLGPWVCGLFHPQSHPVTLESHLTLQQLNNLLLFVVIGVYYAASCLWPNVIFWEVFLISPLCMPITALNTVCEDGFYNCPTEVKKAIDSRCFDEPKALIFLSPGFGTTQGKLVFRHVFGSTEVKWHLRPAWMEVGVVNEES